MTLSRCERMSPPEWTDHWREWHRGHGCDRDPDAAAISAHSLSHVVRTNYEACRSLVERMSNRRNRAHLLASMAVVLVCAEQAEDSRAACDIACRERDELLTALKNINALPSELAGDAWAIARAAIAKAEAE